MSSGHVVLTGGAGFIGSHLLRALTERGDRVVVVDDLSTWLESNLEGVSGDWELARSSIVDAGRMEQVMAGAKGVIHLAALPSVARSVEAPLESIEACATGTAVVLDAARRNGARAVYAGSSSAYGDQDVPAKHEGLRESPLSPYAAAKLAGELWCRSFAQVYGLPVVVTRFFNVFGPRQVPDSPYSGVVAAYCRALLHGLPPRIDGDGKQSRDFTYVEDVVRGVLLALDGDTEGCRIVNLACGGSHTVLDLLEILTEYAKTLPGNPAPVEPNRAPARNGDVRHSLADIRAAQELLGFEPQIPFAEGVRRTFDWYRTQV